MRNRGRVHAILILSAVLTFALDQATKQLAVSALTGAGASREVTSWFSLSLVYNRAGAFGMLGSLPAPARTLALLVLPLLILLSLWWVFRDFRQDERLGPFAIGLVFGGACGNLADRIRLGQVVDFIDWHYPAAGACLPLFHHFTASACHWPHFNLADSAITVAVGLLLLHSLRSPRKP